MKIKLLIVLIPVLYSCNSSKESYIIIEKMDRDTSYSVNTHRNNPSTLKITVTGFANDTFIINKVIIPGGKIDTVLLSDWYDKVLIIEYKKRRVTGGQIKIGYSLY